MLLLLGNTDHTVDLQSTGGLCPIDKSYPVPTYPEPEMERDANGERLSSKVLEHDMHIPADQPHPSG